MRPVLFEMWGFEVRAYTLALCLGYAVGVCIPIVLALRDGRSRRDVVDGAMLFVISGLMGAKLFHVLFESAGHDLGNGRRAEGVLDLLAHDPLHWARIFDSGYVLYGGIVTSAVVMFAFARSRGLGRMGAMFDYAAPALAVGLVIGRLGCFLEGCCYGVATSLPWGVAYPAGHPAGAAVVHPVQLYEVTFACVALGIVVWRYRSRAFEGEVLLGLLGAYAIWRPGIELLRGDVSRGIWLQGVGLEGFGLAGLTTSQLLSAALALSLAGVWRWRVATRDGSPPKPPGPPRFATS